MAEVSFLLSYRFLVTAMCFWSVTNMMYLRLNMSVAIVCMVNHSHLILDTGSVGDSNINNSYQTQQVTSTNNNKTERPSPSQTDGGRAMSPCANGDYNSTGKGIEDKDGPLKWNKLIQGQVLGAYIYGYAVSKIPTGWAVRRMGGKNMILVSSLATSITSLLIPVAALHSFTAIIIMRVFMGLCGGVICPAVQTVLRNWSPPSERSMMGAYTFAGFPIGTLVAFTLAGLLCEFGFADGWPSVFYTFGMLSLVFCLLWAVAVSESPETQLCIKPAEKVYIRTSLAGEATADNKPHSIPWRRILTSPPVYAVIVCGISVDFIGNVFLLYLPTYLVEVMNFDIASSGLLSALPYLFCFFAMALGGHLSDLLLKWTELTTGTVRKLTTGSGLLMCIVSLICISFMDCEQADVVIALLVLSVAGIGLMTIGYFVNPLDIAPEYSSVIVGIASTMGDISGFISPTVVSAITSQGSLRDSWNTVFFMSAGVGAACLIFYICFASGDIQPWALTSQGSDSQILTGKNITLNSTENATVETDALSANEIIAEENTSLIKVGGKQGLPG